MLEQIKNRRKELKMTHAVLSELSGVRQATISEYLAGSKITQAPNVIKICKAMDLKLTAKRKPNKVQSLLIEMFENGTERIKANTFSILCDAADLKLIKKKLQ